jgi:hypothetical protein
MTDHRRTHKIKIRKRTIQKIFETKRKITILDNKHHNTTNQNNGKFPFTHRVNNLTQIKFSAQEMHIVLCKGLQYTYIINTKLGLKL